MEFLNNLIRLQPPNTSHLATDTASHPVDTLHSGTYHMQQHLLADMNYKMTQDKKVSDTFSTLQIISCN